ncbi:protein STIP1 homolog isoform X2 [Chelmon rostratus]|uniref:protein STIP1 homolog isoform X2 n=1 Tax=Chelmon rostratus TaxID=109905 RepID=UPI001BE68174|nr:protein STIP1 homolog isoform X2 [Chelmon rostratus]
MPRKKDIFKGGAPVDRIRENSRIVHTHESMMDYVNGRHPVNSFLDVLTAGFFDFLWTADGNLDNDILYSDDDDDDDDDDFYPHNVSHRPLEPHPRIRQLTDEEAEKHTKELIDEERRKEKTERNKRKKLRKKEKKRLEKENAVKDLLPEEEQGNLDSSENQDKTPVIESNAEASESPESGKSKKATEAVGCEESSDNNKEENLLKMDKKEDEEQKNSEVNNSNYVSTANSAPEETCNQRPSGEKKKKKSKLLEGRESKEEDLKVEEKPEIQKKEEKHEPIKETTVDPMVEEFARRSRELAGIGNRLAASGQYEMAVKYFTDAIKYNPKEFKLFGNRSLCYERMQQYENALRDADLALCMEPNWIKGLFRKGKALCGLKRYYDASLIYKEVLQLESSSIEATQELKRAQTLHLMEMGFNWTQSSEALKTHATLEEAVEALFGGDSNPDAAVSRDNTEQPVVEEDDDDDDDEGEWTVLQTSRPRTQQIRESNALGQSRSKSQSPTPHSRNSVKPKRFPIWVGSLAPSITYATLHELFSRAGTVNGIKMLLEHQCAFVNYTRKEDCERAIQCINGMVVEGSPLSVRYPSKIYSGLGMSKSAATDPYSQPGPYKKECFFWRTTGCTRSDCTYKHVPEHKNIDRDKFTSRLGNHHM